MLLGRVFERSSDDVTQPFYGLVLEPRQFFYSSAPGTRDVICPTLAWLAEAQPESRTPQAAEDLVVLML